jgi:hypothetical protein
MNERSPRTGASPNGVADPHDFGEVPPFEHLLVLSMHEKRLADSRRDRQSLASSTCGW